MASIPNDYPFRVSDKDLESTLQGLYDDIVESSKNEHGVLILDPIKTQTFISLGQSELQKRITAKESESSKRFARSSLWLSISSIIIAAVSLGISVYFAIKTDRTEKLWLESELRLLENSNNQSQQQLEALNQLKAQIWLLRQESKGQN